MAPGNGWGGTTAMGAEVDAWMRHTNRWQPTPSHRIRAIWFCPKRAQFELVRQNLEEWCIGTVPRFLTSGLEGPRYVWPGGDTLYLGSYESGWKGFQGIELDLVAFDEQPPLPLWKEMMMRRRGMRQTKYICKATQTEGISWMAKEIYEPWLTFHAERGIDEERAMQEQRHPTIWCWPAGGPHDNPALSDDDIRWYEAQRFSSANERHVRLFGGFRSFVTNPVFDEAGLEWLRSMQDEWEIAYGAAREGSLVPVDIAAAVSGATVVRSPGINPGINPGRLP